MSSKAWVHTTPLVAKPDQLIKRRGKAGLLALNKSYPEAKKWIQDRAGKPQRVEAVVGTLNNFIVEPFLPHPQHTEAYICITSARSDDTILFSPTGGVDVGDVDAHALRLNIPALPSASNPFPTRGEVQKTLLASYEAGKRKEALTDFILRLYSVYVDLHFAYLEINPLVVLDDGSIHYLDMAAKLDQTAEFICGPKWSIARDTTRTVDRQWSGPLRSVVTSRRKRPIFKSLTRPRVLLSNSPFSTPTAVSGLWLLVVTPSQAAGYAHELANYGEYSGAPSEGQTYEYAKTISPRPDGKILIIGGGIANFTNVAATFKGIIRALEGAKAGLIAHGVKIYVRRGGPNYQEGLKAMRLLGESLGVPIHVFGPETHITAVVPLALVGMIHDDGERIQPDDVVVRFDSAATENGHAASRPSYRPFDAETRSFVYGLQPRAIQGMLDFDYSCKRSRPSVAAMIYPFGGHHIQKFYWGLFASIPMWTSSLTLPVAVASTPVLLTASSTPGIRAIALIAEGVPERQARELLWRAKEKGVLIIGPATVGGIKPGCFRIGNSWRDDGQHYLLEVVPSWVLLSAVTVIPEPPSSITCAATKPDPACKMLVLLGEVGGVEEYAVIDAVKRGEIKKPIIAWAIGTCAKMFTTEVQFGHAGSMANSDSETADAKNRAMRAAGFIVPDTFEQLPDVLRATYARLVQEGTIVPAREVDPPVIPMDYKWAQELGLIRKPAAFISTISDERGQELMYAGMRISDVFKEEIGVGGVVSLLWFKRRLPPYATKFIEMVLMLTADHGPAVSGAMNTIVTTRAGKDLISSLTSGLLTIGSRFGGALDEAAAMFSSAKDRGLTPREFVDESRKANRLISGIGHKIKSVNNPDLRVELVKRYVTENFPSHSLLDYALAVERVTTAKKDTLILNVDGCIAVCFVDLLRDSGAFTPEEADEYIKIGTLNGLFVLGRSIGFIGHHLDQKRLRAPLYRHPADDIFINMADVPQPRVLGKMQ
ncbi:ATP citrate lyase [Pisolithus marmoratus]|nr:ATP citrate lyase [Pisolithus marmoratus]